MMYKQIRNAIVWVATLGLSGVALGQLCVSVEPPATGCDIPRVISGAVGHHIVMMDVSTATGTSTICNGIFTTHNVWFEVTPDISGPMTITTCHPATQYDTVLQVYSGGDAQCDFMVEDTCNDDDQYGTGCTSGCGPRSSTVLVQAIAGVRYRFVVGSYGAIPEPTCQPCLGVRVTIGAPCGDPPNNLAPTLATEFPGEPGVYTAQVDVTDAIKLPSEPNPSCTGPDVGHSVWFATTPTQNGRITFTTCEPLTDYDTVVALYEDGGGGLLFGLDCSDDDFDSACINTCDPAPRGSTVLADVEAGKTYLIQVGSYNNNSTGCTTPLCLGVRMTLEDTCGYELSPPEVALLTPPELTAGCTCPGVLIDGWAYDPNGTFDQWILEYRPVGSFTWNGIAGNSGEVLPPGGPLALWNLGLPQGYYVLRLTAQNVCSRASSVERTVYLDGQFDTLDVRYPPTSGNAIVGGRVCLEGTVVDNWCFDNFVAQYRPVSGGSFQPVDPGNPVYSAGVLNDPFAWWDTISLALPDGDYELRVEGTTDCGNGSTETWVVTVDNTPPTGEITSPANCDSASGVIPIIGTVDDANLDFWVLEYTGGAANQWDQIDSGFSPIVGGLLTNWDTTALPACAYTLRLRVYDRTILGCNSIVRQAREQTVSLLVGDVCAVDCQEDLDFDGDVDFDDLNVLLSVYGTFCN